MINGLAFGIPGAYGFGSGFAPGEQWGFNFSTGCGIVTNFAAFGAGAAWATGVNPILWGGAGAAGAGGATAAAEQMQNHHSLPREFAAWFERAGLNIENYVNRIPISKHILKPDGIHTNSGGNWNKVWKEFIRANPKAKAGEILEQLDKMKDAFGL